MNLQYKTPKEAFDMASARLADGSLQTKAAEYLDGQWPPGFDTLSDVPKAVFAPYLATGCQTEVAFLERASTAGFVAVIATYRDSEYVTTNPGIVDCYRAPLLLSKGQQRRDWVVAESERAGAVGQAQTKYDRLDIISYWQGIRDAVLEDQQLSTNGLVVDFGAWYKMQAERFGWTGGRQKSPYYYMALMAFYASGRAVLFDTPPTSFATRVMEPAYAAATDKLGVEPLLTNEFEPSKRNWVDLSFLEPQQVKVLLTSGRIVTDECVKLAEAE